MASSDEDRIFAQNLSARMTNLGLTPESLAARIGVQPETVTGWVRGDHRPRDLPTLADTLGVTVAALTVPGGIETGTSSAASPRNPAGGVSADTVFADHAARIRALEEREATMRAEISALKAQVAALGEQQKSAGHGGLFGAAPGTVVNPMAAAPPDPDTQKNDARHLVRAIGEQVLNAADEDDDFTIDNVTVEARGGFDIEGGKAQIATNARQQATSQNASKITFSVRRRRKTQIID